MLIVFIVALGLVNWIGTELVVDSEFFRPLRSFFGRRMFKAKRRWAIHFWGKSSYLVNCKLCTGTWIGFALAPFAPIHVNWLGFIVVALLIKAIGHILLVWQNYVVALTDEARHSSHGPALHDDEPPQWLYYQSREEENDGAHQ